MKYKLKIHYSVEDHGDGSAYPRFFSSEKLAYLHQENLDPGWGEPCVGSITVTSDSPITCSNLTSREDLLKDVEERAEYDDSLGDYIEALKAL